MRKRGMIPIIILLSLVLNIGYAITVQDSNRATQWPFFELGPSVIQDSFYVRAPGVESPFGIIGDVPGGYSLYTGNPLQSGKDNSLANFTTPQLWVYGQPIIEMSVILLGVFFALIPVTLILFLGRRSYGSTKTQ
jgi:hypothetical protein